MSRRKRISLQYRGAWKEVYDKDDPALVNFGHKKGCEVMFKPTREKDLVAMIKSMT